MFPVKAVLLFFTLFLAIVWKSSEPLYAPSHEEETDPLMLSCRKFETLYQNIGDSTITPDSASLAFKTLFLELRQITEPFWQDCRKDLADGYVFPVRGYYPKSSIGGRGKGYRPAGFDFFDSRVRKSHPAHDIFIKDRNNDGIDDIMCEPVDVLAFTGGLVLGIRQDWTPESQWRGGNYVWIYNPCLDALLYYAHNSTVDVRPGQWVKTGDVLGKMGRTGFNAWPPRSPTHLHFMYLKITDEGLPEPYNPLTQLMEAKVVEWE